MAGPIIYGLYLVAGAAGSAAAKYAIKKVAKSATGKLISRHNTKELANKARTRVLNLFSKSKDTGTPGKPGVTAGGGSNKSAVIGRQRVRDYTRNRRLEGGVAGGVVGAGVTAAAAVADDVLAYGNKVINAFRSMEDRTAMKNKIAATLREEGLTRPQIKAILKENEEFLRGRKPEGEVKLTPKDKPKMNKGGAVKGMKAHNYMAGGSVKNLMSGGYVTKSGKK